MSYDDIQEYISVNGVDLLPFGCGMRGLVPKLALELIHLAESEGFVPLGVEIWRKSKQEWSICSLDGWYDGDSTPSPIPRLLELANQSDILAVLQFKSA